MTVASELRFLLCVRSPATQLHWRFSPKHKACKTDKCHLNMETVVSDLLLIWLLPADQPHQCATGPNVSVPPLSSHSTERPGRQRMNCVRMLNPALWWIEEKLLTGKRKAPGTWFQHFVSNHCLFGRARAPWFGAPPGFSAAQVAVKQESCDLIHWVPKQKKVILESKTRIQGSKNHLLWTRDQVRMHCLESSAFIVVRSQNSPGKGPDNQNIQGSCPGQLDLSVYKSSTNFGIVCLGCQPFARRGHLNCALVYPSVVCAIFVCVHGPRMSCIVATVPELSSKQQKKQKKKQLGNVSHECAFQTIQEIRATRSLGKNWNEIGSSCIKLFYEVRMSSCWAQSMC